jgi:hypothetical protein
VCSSDLDGNGSTSGTDTDAHPYTYGNSYSNAHSYSNTCGSDDPFAVSYFSAHSESYYDSNPGPDWVARTDSDGDTFTGAN